MLDEHGQHCFFVCGHNDAHDHDDDLLVGVAFLPVVEVGGELFDQALQEAVGLLGDDALEVLELIGDVGEHSQTQHHHVFIITLGEVEQVIHDPYDIFVLEEDPWEGFRESQEAIERVLFDDKVGIIDEVVEVTESVDENVLDVLFVGIEAQTAEEQGAGLLLTRPTAVDDP